MTQDTSIQISGLSKQYAKHLPYALNSLNLSVKKGEVFGFLGPNGAGKSTTIRLLLNFIQPTKGSATIMGSDIVKDSVDIRSKVSYLSGDFKAYDKMTGRQFLDYMSSLGATKSKKYITELAQKFEISLSKKIGDLSKGNRQKLGIIQAFMTDPDLYILDEPTDGLDPLKQEIFYQLVRENKKRGKTFFISSHNLAEVRKICDKVGIIKAGKLVSESSISDLALEASHTFLITFKGPPPRTKLNQLKGIKAVPSGQNSLRVHAHGDLTPLLKTLSNYSVSRLSTESLSLEEEFMKFYEGDK
ncbi:MAG TPA: ABC transporter ATP-binding protein [Candidatus Saccharibacteria bacterium]|nr:ABC transporter ATP-binding protein [Candidatus Saccharibacteria bacterium]